MQIRVKILIRVLIIITIEISKAQIYQKIAVDTKYRRYRVKSNNKNNKRISLI